jgi:hypothetical protein
VPPSVDRRAPQLSAREDARRLGSAEAGEPGAEATVELVDPGGSLAAELGRRPPVVSRSTPIRAASTNSSSIAGSPTARQPIETSLPWMKMSPPRSVRPSSAARARS